MAPVAQEHAGFAAMFSGSGDEPVYKFLAVLIVQKTIARRLLAIHGEKAFMLALLEMEDAYEKKGYWRKILDFMEEFNKEKDDDDVQL